MPRHRVLRIQIAVTMSLLVALALRAGAAEPVEYELRFGKPSSHLLEISLRAGGLKGPSAEFAMPAWARKSVV